MSVEVDATPGSPTANSFADESHAAAYAQTRLGLQGWVSVAEPLTEDERRALVEATRDLDALLYRGARASAEQGLEWPRVGTEYAEGEVPRRLQDATVELAIQYLARPLDAIAGPDPMRGVIRKKIDVLETEWEKTGSRPEGVFRFPRVAQLVRPLLATGEEEALVAVASDPDEWPTVRSLR